jgi:hypothetical protein
VNNSLAQRKGERKAKISTNNNRDVLVKIEQQRSKKEGKRPSLKVLRILMLSAFFSLIKLRRQELKNKEYE